MCTEIIRNEPGQNMHTDYEMPILYKSLRHRIFNTLQTLFFFFSFSFSILFLLFSRHHIKCDHRYITRFSFAEIFFRPNFRRILEEGKVLNLEKFFFLFTNGEYSRIFQRSPLFSSKTYYN